MAKVYLIEFLHSSYPVIQEKELVESNSSVNAWGIIQQAYEKPTLLDIKVVEEL